MADHLPLNALRTFEVAARTGSFVAAGEELGVSSAAVSQQVKVLEATLNRTLFLRQGNRITLTDAGRALYPRLEAVFSDLVALTRDLRAGKPVGRLTVSALPSLAELWLVPALARYPARHRIDLRIEEDPVDFARSGADLRITYGAHYYPGFHADVLFRDRFIAVTAPPLAGKPVPNPETLKDSDLIHTDWGPSYIRQPSWAEWFAAAGLARLPSSVSGLRTDSTLASALAAQSGAGAALVPEHLAQDAIRGGRLIRISEASVALFSEYVLVYPHAFARRQPLTDLCGFLKGQSGALSV